MPMRFDPNVIPSATYATLPAASAVPVGYRVRATDIGIAPGMMLVCDGTRWIPDGVQVLARSTIPFIWAPTGTMANNGAVTLGTALPTTYAGAYMLFPASAIVSGSAAGWYWVVMSSTTVGTVKNNTYTSGIPTIPASPIAFSTTGPGAFTGITAQTNSVSPTLPGKLNGLQGTVNALLGWSMTNSANTKTTTFLLGGSTVHAVNTTSTAGADQLFSFTNDNSAAAQVGSTGSYGVGSNGSGALRTTVDTSTDQTMAIAGTRGTATEYLILDRTVWTVNP